jgi:hypothetical protein
MALSASEIVVGATGNVRVAPVGTTAPVDVATAWAAGWIDLGYATEDGVTLSNERTTEDIMAWQALDPVRTVGTARLTTVSFQLMQWNETTVPLAFGGGTVTPTAGPPAHYRYDPPADATPDERALGIQWADGTKVYRLIIPRAVVTESVETNLVKNAAGLLPLTFRALGTDGAASWYIRTSDPAFAV